MGFVSQSKIREHLAPQQVTVRERERGGGDGGRRREREEKVAALRILMRVYAAVITVLF